MDVGLVGTELSFYVYIAILYYANYDCKIYKTVMNNRYASGNR